MDNYIALVVNVCIIELYINIKYIRTYKKGLATMYYIPTETPYKAKRRKEWNMTYSKKPVIVCFIAIAFILAIQPLFDTTLYSNIVISLS